MTHKSSNIESFIPRRRLRGGHWQTLAGNFMRRDDKLPSAEARMVEVDKGVSLLCHSHWQPAPADATTIIVLHGLEGSSASQYMVGVGNKAWAAGMNVVRMNMRNCGGTEDASSTLYHSGLSGDVDAVIKYFIAERGLKKIVCAGYSMGGNIMMKLAGEYGRDNSAPKEVAAFASVSPALDLGPSCDALNLPQNRFYELRFVWNLKRRMRRKAALFPGAFDLSGLSKIHSVREFDDKITARYAGFNGADDYYYRAAAARVVEHINLPTLILHSLDDPFIRVLPDTRAKLLANPNITYIETAHGGHCAFLADPNGYDGRWAEKTLVEFLKNH
jgi:predicted alpha/beta-fold hydrolase